MKASRINHPDRIEAARFREEVRQAIADHPGITAKELALIFSKDKSTIYQHIGILRAQGKLISQAQGLPDGKHGKQLCYSVAKCEDKALNVHNRFDYPTQTTVAAMDHAKLPPMDELTACLFGRTTKENA